MIQVSIGGTDPGTVLAWLRYLYTDTLNLESEDTDLFSLLAFAARMKTTRLVTLCELEITKMVERTTATSLSGSDTSVAEILALARSVQAAQLIEFCLHFLSTNYLPMAKKGELRKLARADKSYVDAHRWPKNIEVQ